jgi:iron complex outermembrane recepter protein
MQKIIFILFVLFFGRIWSQNTITGTIMNEEKKALFGAHVHIGAKATNTDVEGNYLVQKVPNGKTKLFISYIGYQSIDTVIVVHSSMTLSFTLKKKTELLNEVKVNRKENSYNQSLVEQKVKTEVIERNSNLTLGDALKSVTGVSILKTGSTIVKPVINGLHSSRVPIISNNVRLEDQQWGIEHSPNFDVNSAGKITVIKGASGLQFGGDAVGGLIIVEPVLVKKDTLFGKTNLSIASNGNGGSVSTSMHKGNFCDWSWNVQGSFKYMGDRETPNYVLSNSGNREANFSGNVNYIGKKYEVAAFYSYFNTTIGILSASHIGNVTDLYNAIQNQVPYLVNDFTYSIQNPKQEVQHHLGKMKYSHIFSEKATLHLQYAYQYNKRYEFDVRRGNQNDKPALDLTLKTHSLHTDFKKEYEHFELKTGGSALFQNNFANLATEIRPLIPNYDKFDAGIYSIVTSNLSDSFSVEGGLRYDYSKMEANNNYFKSRWTERNYSPTFDSFIVGEYLNYWLTKPNFVFHNFSASLGFHKSFEHQWDAFFNVSHAVRNPNPSEFFSDGLHHSSGMIELGNLYLQKEKSTKLAITLQKKGSRMVINVNPYLNSIANFMFLKPVGLESTSRGAFPVWEYQQTHALLTGIDVETNWDITSNLKYLFSLAYVNGENLSNNEKLIDMPPLSINSTLRFSKKEWSQLNLELKNEWMSRQQQFPNYNFVTKIPINGELTPILVDISSPPKAYHLLHFYSDIKLKINHDLFATVAFSVQNIMNTTYRDYLNRQRFFVDEMGRNIQIQIKINY